ncbi:MAG: PorV/PorQ family protein [Bacteroidota bacterium]
MKKFIKIISIAIVASYIFIPCMVKAGNKDRAGSAGASQLLINPWAKSSGMGNSNTASIRGLEASFLNVAGTAFTKKSEFMFAHTIYLKGADVNINSFGFTQKVGKEGAGGVLGLSIMNMSFGDLMITTTELPEGGIGTFSPSLMNIGISYAKAFSNSIFGGINVKIISESISDVKGQGVAIDAGIQYVTGEAENIKFGISLKNVGTPIKYTGDGLTFRGYVPGAANAMTISHRSSFYELPSLLNIGGAYDFNFKESYKLTLAGNFTSNSFTKDIFCGGLEFALKDLFFLRAGYTYEMGQEKIEEKTTIFTGPTAGFTVKVPLNKENGTHFDLDYSYRATNPFTGCHSIGARINL